jgi:hypothetical protein
MYEFDIEPSVSGEGKWKVRTWATDSPHYYRSFGGLSVSDIRNLKTKVDAFLAAVDISGQPWCESCQCAERNCTCEPWARSTLDRL